jgi:hypothetical protein
MTSSNERKRGDDSNERRYIGENLHSANSHASGKTVDDVFAAPVSGQGGSSADELLGTQGTHQYNLVLPRDLYAELKRVAAERGTSVLDLLRRFIRLGLYVVYLQSRQNAELVVREGDSEKTLVLF